MATTEHGVATHLGLAASLTEDFAILGGGSACPADEVVRLSAEVPAMLQGELSAVLHSVVQIRRRRRLGLVHARRQLEGLAAEFYRYGDDAFIVPGHNANVAEAFDHARTRIVDGATPAFLDGWRRGGAGLRVRRWRGSRHVRAVLV